MREKFDFLPAMVNASFLNMKFQNYFTKHWPRSGTAVSRYTIYRHENQFYWPGGSDTPDHVVSGDNLEYRQIFKQLGIDIETIKDEEWKGVESFWFFLNAEKYLQGYADREGFSALVNNSDIYSYLFTYESAEKRKQWHYVECNIDTINQSNNNIYYQTAFSPFEFQDGIVINKDTVNAEVNTGSSYAWRKLVPIYDENAVDVDGNPVSNEDAANRVMMVLVDHHLNGGQVYEVKLSSYEYQEPTTGVKTFRVVVAYRERVFYDADMNVVETPAITDPVFTDLAYKIKEAGIYSTDFKRRYIFDSLASSSAGWEGMKLLVGGSGAGYAFNMEALKHLQHRDFITVIAESFDNDYKKREAEGWMKILAIILIVVVIIVSFVLMAPTGGYSLALGASAISALANGILIAFSMGLIATQLVIMYFDSAGYAGTAEYFGKVAKILTTVIKIAGIVALVAGAYTMFFEKGISLLSQSGVKMVLKLANTGFNEYKQIELKKDAKEIEELQRQNTEILDKIEDLEHEQEASRVIDDFSDVVRTTVSKFTFGMPQQLMEMLHYPSYAAVTCYVDQQTTASVRNATRRYF